MPNTVSLLSNNREFEQRDYFWSFTRAHLASELPSHTCLTLPFSLAWVDQIFWTCLSRMRSFVLPLKFNIHESSRYFVRDSRAKHWTWIHSVFDFLMAPHAFNIRYLANF